MAKYLFTLSVFLLCTNFAFAKEKDIHTIVHFKHEEFNLEEPGKATYFVQKKYTRLNPSAPGAELVLGYSDDYQLKDVKVRIFNAEGEELASFKEKDFYDQKMEDRISIFIDGRFKALDLRQPDYPYTIEYEYEYAITGIYGINDWHPVSFNTQTISSSFTCKVPKDYILHYKPVNTDLQPQLSIDGNQDIYRWELQNPDVIVKEPSMPISELVLPMVLISPSQFEIEGYKGDMSTWEEFGRFKYEINKDREEVSPSLQNKIIAMTSSCKSEKEKIEVLYSFLQEQCRYVSVQIGIGGWQTFPASYVEENRYGDCKALTNFMKAMLKVVDIPSYMAAISAGQDHAYIDQNFVNGGFNHVILFIPSQDMWLECTRKNTPAGYLGSFTHDRYALLFKEDKGQLRKTPVYNHNFNTTTTVTDIFYDKDGNARVQEEKIMKGINQESIRLPLESFNSDEMRERILASYTVTIQTLDSLEIDLDRAEPLAAVSTQFTVNRLASKAGNRLFINLTSLQQDFKLPEELENRTHPYQIAYGFTLIDTMRIHYPENYELENVSFEKTALQEPFGSFSVELFNEKAMLTIVKKMVLKKGTVLPSGYQKYYDFFKTIKKTENNKLILVNPRP
jgi:hypothetical protein